RPLRRGLAGQLAQPRASKARFRASERSRGDPRDVPARRAGNRAAALAVRAGHRTGRRPAHAPPPVGAALGAVLATPALGLGPAQLSGAPARPLLCSAEAR